jgi:hypothetical protein
MRKRLLVLAVLTAAITAAIVVTDSSGAGGAGAVANFTTNKVKIEQSGNSTPDAAWSTIGRVTLPVGSWVITAHTVATIASNAPTGTDVECYLNAPNATPGFTATGLLPSKANDERELTTQTVGDTPNGGTASFVCRVNTVADNKLVLARETSVIATSVAGTSTTDTSMG